MISYEPATVPSRFASVAASTAEADLGRTTPRAYARVREQVADQALHMRDGLLDDEPTTCPRPDRARLSAAMSCTDTTQLALEMRGDDAGLLEIQRLSASLDALRDFDLGAPPC